MRGAKRPPFEMEWEGEIAPHKWPYVPCQRGGGGRSVPRGGKEEGGGLTLGGGRGSAGKRKKI